LLILTALLSQAAAAPAGELQLDSGKTEKPAGS
jgi:hypothetical protein